MSSGCTSVSYTHLAGSVAVQLLRVAQAYCLGLALGIAAPATAYLAFIPMILLVMLLPVTINGIGTSQVAFVWFFGKAGTPAPEAFALSVLFLGLGVLGNLPGGLLYALNCLLYTSGPARTLCVAYLRNPRLETQSRRTTRRVFVLPIYYS